MGCLVDDDENEDDASNRRRAVRETGDGECAAWNSGAGAGCSACRWRFGFEAWT